MKTRLAHALILGLAALVLAACATATLTRLAYANAALAYTNLGPMITWMVDDYVDLSDLQEDWVRDRVARAMEWHRTQELPKYRSFLESTLAKTEAPFTAADVAAHQKMVRTLWLRVMDRVMPDMAEFLANLDSEQAAQLERKFAEDNRKYSRETAKGTPEERRTRRMVRFIDHLETWVGSLNPEQRDLVAAYYRTLPDLSEDFLAERRTRQAEILKLVRARTPKDAMAVQLRRLFVDLDSWRRPELQQQLRERDRKTQDLFAALSGTLTADQRSALQKRIRGFMRDIATLTAAT